MYADINICSNMPLKANTDPLSCINSSLSYGIYYTETQIQMIAKSVLRLTQSTNQKVKFSSEPQIVFH